MVIQTNEVLLLLVHGSLVGDVDTVQEFSDILVAHSANTLDRRSRLGDVLDVIALENKLILLCLGLGDDNTIKHIDMPDELLAQKVPNLNFLPAILDNAVDGEMGINRTHLVAEALGDTSNHILDQTLDRPQARDMLASALPYRECDRVVLAGLDELDVHVHMSDVFGQFTARALDVDQA